MTGSNSKSTSDKGAVPELEGRPIYLRAYGEAPPAKPKKQTKNSIGDTPSDWVVVFDTETIDDESQRLRFGAFQLRVAGELVKKGLFYDRDAVTQDEVEMLQREARRHHAELMPVGDFVQDYVLDKAWSVGGSVVGFNLPFDLSRVAIGHESALSVRRTDGSLDRSMAGGFTFALSPLADRPNLRVKHLSRRAAFINFAGAGKQGTPRNRRKVGEKRPPERGFFIDVKTLAAALTSQSHTLKSLAKILGTAPKSNGGDFGRPIDAEMIAYGLNDVQVTWECFAVLMARYAKHGLAGTPAHKIYSEAGVGKAYLRQLGVRTWRETQPDFDPKLIGIIMSSYFGGRAEVRTRRQITRSLYCDFASMYPTVCTLMGLWEFVISNGMDAVDATDEVRQFLGTVDLATLQNPATWKRLQVLVHIMPDADIVPVRARYGDEPVATIGVNYLSADRPLWFTLADCIASKLLTGKAPTIVKALRFVPRENQDGLRIFPIGGDESQTIDPRLDDFFKKVTSLRLKVKARFTAAKSAKPRDQDLVDRLEAEQLGLKILANATSYGVFIELNVEEPEPNAPPIVVHTSGGSSQSQPAKVETPGSYFHPLLGTLITGAARLMLAITERQLFDRGLDWVFCDTDSMAFAMPVGMDPHIFQQKVTSICEWFEPLNPYGEPDSILQFEKQNFAAGTDEPLYCLAISAKRYALFNYDAFGNPIIRKASAHGLGHLIPPYGSDDEDASPRESGVHLWQEDVWAAIIKAVSSEHPLKVALDWNPALSGPAASRYGATAPTILSWFNSHNKSLPYPKQVRPFNFLLWFHAKRPVDMVRDNPDFEYQARMRQPKPVAPYSKTPSKVLDKIIDRETGDAVLREWLRSYADTLRGYHTHQETKFNGGRAVEAGVLQRRHVFVTAVNNIGKESDSWEDDEVLGSDADTILTYGLSADDRAAIAASVIGISVRTLKAKARVSAQTIQKVAVGDTEISDAVFLRIAEAVRVVRAELASDEVRANKSIAWLVTKVEVEGLSVVAGQLSLDPSNLRKLIGGRRRLSGTFIRQMEGLASTTTPSEDDPF